MYRLLKRLLFLFDPEAVHHAVVQAVLRLTALSAGLKLLEWLFVTSDPRLEKEVMGLKFPNPVGLAAGFDKDASFFHRFFCFGFGFIEIGTLTPLAQDGNPKPRMFRLPADGALVNRMGFNNKGAGNARNNLQKFRRPGMIVGGNIGKNKNTPNQEAISDYLDAFNTLFDAVDYFVINVSSPNTPGLRQLQDRVPLLELLHALQQENLSRTKPRPILLKIAPDLQTAQLDDIAAIVVETGITGIVAGNTTLSRAGLTSPAELTREAGGLSGKPLAQRATQQIRFLRQALPPGKVIIGVGGISSGQDALEKLKAGADLVQIYTGFVFEGPGLPGQINRYLLKHLPRPAGA